MDNKALGKGLSALLSDSVEKIDSEGSKLVKTQLIKNNRLQPRTNYDEAKLAELISSIREKGVLQPILVRESGEYYEVIAGERRLRAARELKLDKVPVVIKSVTDKEALVLALVENIQREELNAIEEAKGFKKLIEDFGYSHDDVAQAVGKDRSTVTNLIRLLKLPKEIQDSLYQGQTTVGHARALLSLDSQAGQKKINKDVIRKGLSVRSVEALVKKILEQKIAPVKEKDTVVDHDLHALAEVLQKHLGTKVRLQGTSKKGKITVEYYSLDDLDRIVGIIKQ